MWFILLFKFFFILLFNEYLFLIIIIIWQLTRFTDGLFSKL